jgi:hypothetical protein
MNTPRTDAARMPHGAIREDSPMDASLRPASGRRGATTAAPPTLWTRGELALFHPYYHDDWADEFATLACDDEVWGFGDTLSTQGQGVAAWKTR